MFKNMIKKIGLISVIPVFLAANANAVRIKDITEIKGVRHNQLIGYGLLVGLDGTGDGKNSKFTIQSMGGMLEKMGVTVNNSDIKGKNVAAVMLTAELPPFARVGSRVDVIVSSIGGAKSLQGGTLLLTPLKAADGNIYAVAQGPVSTGGFSAQGASGSGVQKNFPTVGRLVGGALIEREIPTEFDQKKTLSLALHHPDFTTVTRIAMAINEALLEKVAYTPDAGTVKIKVPEKYSGNIVGLVTLIEGLGVTPDIASKVVINERTGTVIMGENVRISTIAIAHGNLSVQIRETQDVSQPLPFSKGQTEVTPESDVMVREGKNPIFLVNSAQFVCFFLELVGGFFIALNGGFVQVAVHLGHKVTGTGNDAV